MESNSLVGLSPLVKVIGKAGLDEKTAIVLGEKFVTFMRQIEEWKGKAALLVVTDASQKRDMGLAREGRLILRDVRVGADKLRKALKEDGLRYNKAVQDVYNVIDREIRPIEEHLYEQEKFVEIQEAKRVSALAKERGLLLEPYSRWAPYIVEDLGVVSDEEFSKMLRYAKDAMLLEQQREQEAEEVKMREEHEREQARLRLEEENRVLKATVEAERAENIKIRGEIAIGGVLGVSDDVGVVSDNKVKLERLYSALDIELIYSTDDEASWELDEVISGINSLRVRLRWAIDKL